jgi:ABC-type phosphate/phosphonate transport system permease subunit
MFFSFFISFYILSGTTPKLWITKLFNELLHIFPSLFAAFIYLPAFREIPKLSLELWLVSLAFDFKKLKEK